MQIVCIAGPKGGCGKTTTAINLSGALAAQGKRVLLIDLDRQGHSALGLGLRPELRPGIYDVLTDTMDLDQAIVSDHLPNLSVLPPGLSPHDAADVSPEAVLTQLRDGLESRYDHVVLDCPPGINPVSSAALSGSDVAIVPLEMSTYAFHGLARLMAAVTGLQLAGGRPGVVRIVPAIVDNRTRLERGILKDLWERYAEELAPLFIPHSVRIKEAATAGKTLHEFDARCPAAAAYDRLAEELLRTLVPSGRASRITLRLPGFAGHEVCLAGDFNDWIPDRGVDTAVCEGVLEKTVRLRPGRYEYRLIVDGEWTEDPNNAACTPNPVGGLNSLLIVGEKEMAAATT